MQLLPHRRIALLIGLLTVLGSAQAGIYKWTDAQGNVHYTQTPPTDVESQSIKAPSAPPEPVENNDTAEDEKGEEDKPVVTKRDEVVQKNCEAAKKNLNIYTNYRRIVNEKGEMEVLDEKVRQAKIKESKKQIKEYCK